MAHRNDSNKVEIFSSFFRDLFELRIEQSSCVAVGIFYGLELLIIFDRNVEQILEAFVNFFDR